MKELRFDGKVALVTGAGRGVGRCHALSLASRGAKVVVADIGGSLDGKGSSSAPADEVVKEIKAAGGNAVSCFASVSEEAGAASMVKTALDTFGRLDILINNAGISDPDLFEDLSTARIRQMIDVHYYGTVYTCKAAWAHFLKSGGGRIVNTCSEGSFGINRKLSSYGAGKGAVLALTMCLAGEGVKHNIAVNGFAPRASTRLAAPDHLAYVLDLPAAMFERGTSTFLPELASPAAIYLAHESCTLNGVLLVSGGNEVFRIAVMANPAVKFDHVTVEGIAEKIGQITDMSKDEHFGVGIDGKASMDEMLHAAAAARR
jgi:NAD(P)-dependent dehydrogenase (short-subunit alcohol dehydrogenase family)